MGGGRRPCEEEGCTKWGLGSTRHCIAHGGGRRCQHEGCLKGAEGGKQHCVSHGGGRRCQQVGCTKAAAGGGTLHCVSHGGGRRCQLEGCTKSAVSATSSAIFRYFKVPVQHQEHVLWYVPTSHPTRFHNLAHETAGDGYPRTSWCKPPIGSRYGASMATPRGKSHHGQVFLAAERSSEALVPSRDSSAGAARSRRGRGWGAGVW
jgi:hypothetical protein